MKQYLLKHIGRKGILALGFLVVFLLWGLCSDVVLNPFSSAGRNAAPMGAATALFKKEEFLNPANKNTLTYYMHTPEAYASYYPLVLVLHGAPGKSYAAKYLQAAEKKYPAYIVAPNLARVRGWGDWSDNLGDIARAKQDLEQNSGIGDAVALVQMLVDKLGDVDTSRIYVIGCSEGGFAAFAAALYWPDIFAAAVPISGGWYAGDAQDFTTPLMVIHGQQDRTINPGLSQGISEEIISHGGDIVYRPIEDMGHECPSERLYDAQTFDWLFAQSK